MPKGGTHSPPGRRCQESTAEILRPPKGGGLRMTDDSNFGVQVDRMTGDSNFGIQVEGNLRRGAPSKWGAPGVPKAPKGPSLSSRRFQPAESRAGRMTPTPTGLTCSSAPSGPVQVFRCLSVGFTHGYSRHAPSGQLPPHHVGLPKLPSFVTLHFRGLDGTLYGAAGH